MFIRGADCRVIANSRKEKTLEIKIKTFEGVFTSSAPSGKSRGKREVEPYVTHEHGGLAESYQRLRRFCNIIEGKNFIIKKLDDLKMVNDLIDKLEHRFGHMGGNVRYIIQTAFLKAAAADSGRQLWQLIHDSVGEKKIKIPMPVGNCIGGAKHSKEVDGKKPDFQEFLLIPPQRYAKTFSKAVTLNLRAYEMAKKLIHARSRNDENAWQTSKNNEEVLEILRQVAKKDHLRIGLDIAASSFFENDLYRYKNKSLRRDREDQIEYLHKLIKKYKIFYVEDPLQEEDFPGFRQLLELVKKQRHECLIVGDDLTTTHSVDFDRAMRNGSINAIIIKPNQVGDIIEVARVVEKCKKYKIKMIFSHRSGETMDDSLADYCVGFGGDFIKCGIYGRERMIKMKRVIEIEQQMKK